MKFLLLFSVALIGNMYTFSQDVSALIKAAEETELSPNESQAYSKFRAILKIDPDNIYVLTKCSELSSRIGSREKTEQNRNAWFKSAHYFADKALAIAPKNDRANVAKAIVLGKSSLTKSGKEKIKDAKEIKRFIDVALQANPSNYLALHVLGRWHYELSEVNMFERAAAKVFFGSIPTGSISESIKYFEKVRSLAPGLILNYYELAKAYHKNDEDAKAIQILKDMQHIPNTTEDDARIKTDGLKYIAAWK